MCSYSKLDQVVYMTNGAAAPLIPVEMQTFRLNKGMVNHIRQVNHVSMRPGCIMLDTGCKASVAGTNWHEGMTRAVVENGYEDGFETTVQSDIFSLRRW